MHIPAKIFKAIKNGNFLDRVVNKYSVVKRRIKKRVWASNLFYPFYPERVRTKKYQELIPQINKNHYQVGNYYLDKRKSLTPTSVIYSLGIGEEVSFDDEVSKMFSCSVYMYDPTPASIDFIKKNYSSNKYFKFFPVGIWIENTILKFYSSSGGGSSSAVYSTMGKNFFEAKCVTMEDVLKENFHTHIDVFKADIEGAALPILEQMIEKTILPEQIVVELERHKEGNDDFFSRVDSLREKLKNLGYEEFNLPREKWRYFSLELLFVRIG